ncbi:MAG: acetyl-CoA carboxylase carboxyltransferase subunit [Bacteroidetes bacterium]|nr:MAG: acetyl-CoA carboxylase carboxyltransferase subunit [Bacteroidota bacterium]
MHAFKSKIDPKSEKFKENQAWMKGKVKELNDLLAKSQWQGEEKHIAKAKKAGKMLARERIKKVLDSKSPYLNLLPLVGYGRESFALGGTMAACIGLVNKRLCMVIANIATIKGGSIDQVTLEKALRLNNIAMENRLPTIYLVESAGANLEEQAKIFNLGGTNFREITRRSKEGIPTISVVFGNSTAGGAYIPGMSDYVIMVKKQAKVFLAGPPLVKMATGEESDDETLGGAEMHSRISGVSDFLAKDEKEAIEIARDLMALVNVKTQEGELPPKGVEPKYNAEELLGIVGKDPRQGFDMREIIARIVDGSEFLEFKAEYGPTLVTGFAKIHGFNVGILANNGVLVSESANKGAHFIQLCNRSNTPLIFFQNITGFMVGKKYEQGGIIKDGAKMINAVSNSGVPALTIIIGASYGAGNYAMCGRAFEPRFLFSWPNSKIAVMGAQQLAGVMQMLKVKTGKADLKDIQKDADTLAEQVDEQSNAFYATGQLWDDGVIDPRLTRHHLGMGLSTIFNAPFEGNNEYGVFRM